MREEDDLVRVIREVTLNGVCSKQTKIEQGIIYSWTLKAGKYSEAFRVCLELQRIRLESVFI